MLLEAYLSCAKPKLIDMNLKFTPKSWEGPRSSSKSRVRLVQFSPLPSQTRGSNGVYVEDAGPLAWEGNQLLAPLSRTSSAKSET